MAHAPGSAVEPSLEQRLETVERALARDPADPRLWVHRAQCLLALGRAREALEAAREAEHRAPAEAALWDAIGTLRSFAQDQPGALAAYERAVALAPGEAQFLFNRASVRRFLGDLEGAEADYDAVLERRPEDDEAYFNRSELRTQTAERNHIAALERRAARAADWRGYVQIHYALAKEYEDLGEHARSFECLRRGAERRRRHMRYDLATDVATVDWIRAAFPQPAPAAPPDAAPDAPVFIVGLPRSGSTLIERILASHSALASAGELDCLAHAVVDGARRLTPGTPFTRRELVARSAHLDFAALGRDYLERARRATGLAGRFIDKMPLNYLYLGLIRRALPQACLIEVERHPLALGYAIYKTLFKDGYPFSYDLEEIAQYMLAQRRLMRHWHATLPETVHRVRYEELVRDAAGVSRRLLEHCRLPWESRCLEFHRNPAASTTASASQVRRPIYDSSTGQWRHYARELAPLRDALIAGGIDAQELE